MAEGKEVVAVMVVLGMLLVFSDMVDARTYVVGKADVFNYNSSLHNVVYVDERAYKTCEVPKDPRYSRVYKTGHDRIQLPNLGLFRFISTMNDDCKRGMRISILNLS
uniref:Basic blue protein n=1 Tax=Phaseolus vulgaris TaxID=3885 RepID=D2DWA4_PHAVU|nr:basic blue protein [Phaseolus vulgaris]